MPRIPLTPVAYVYRRQDANVAMLAHDLTSVSFAKAERPVDLHLVQRALGHRQITTTEIYARVSDDALRQAVAAV